MVLYELREFESIGMKYSEIINEKLKVKYVDELYKFSKSEIVQKTGIDEKRVEQFLNILDLFRIPNMTIRVAELLYYANINSVEELSHRQAARIYFKLKQLDENTSIIILQYPTFAQISEWINFAKLMTRRIKYGLNIPMILFPMINIHQATELIKYQIYTAADFVNAKNFIKGLRHKLNLQKEDYFHLLSLIDLVEIDGIDLILAQILYDAGIKNKSMFNTIQVEIIRPKLEEVLKKYPENERKIYLEEIIELIKKINK